MADPVAYTRRTRTPVYEESSPGYLGIEYNNSPNQLNDLLRQLPILSSIIKPQKYISIDPSRSSGEHRQDVIGHEEIHALLDPIESQLPGLNAHNPFFQKIASAITARYNVDPQAEAPAYVRTPQDLQPVLNPDYNVSQDWFTQYRNRLMGQIMKIDPRIAKFYGQLTPSPQSQPQSTSQGVGR